MKLQATWKKHTLNFTFAAGTSRGVLRKHQANYILIQENLSSRFGIGEASPLKGLSIDDHSGFKSAVKQALTSIQKETPPSDVDEVSGWVKQNISKNFPSILFGVETAWLDWLQGGQRIIYPHAPISEVFAPIPINGLVWMGERDFMLQQVDEKINQGFKCIKLKIGALDFETELDILAYIRKHFSADQITLRVDANGAFTPDEAMSKLKRLAEFDLHSIEQPIAVDQFGAMKMLCQKSPIPIALDEELIGLNIDIQAANLLDTIQPQFIILKPTLLGGLSKCEQWIRLAEERDIGWWMTSALESNIGLNAIAQFAAHKHVQMPQGLGTGQLYHNNLPSPLLIQRGSLHFNPDQPWDLSLIQT